MEKITSYNHRKIINLLLLLVFLLMLVGSTVIKNKQYDAMLWVMMFSNTVTGNAKVGSFIVGGITIVALITSLATIPYLLKKHSNAYFGVQGFMSVILIGLLIANKITKVYEMSALALVIVALAINVIATIYNIFIVKHNYDELYNPQETEVESVEENA